MKPDYLKRYTNVLHTLLNDATPSTRGAALVSVREIAVDYARYISSPPNAGVSEALIAMHYEALGALADDYGHLTLAEIRQRLDESLQTMLQVPADVNEHSVLASFGHRLKIADAIVEKAFDAIIVCRSGRGSFTPEIVSVNRQFEVITGYTAAELIGNSPKILQGPGTDPAAKSRIRFALENAQPARESILNYTKSGIPYWNQVSIAPVYMDAEYVYYVAVQRDVTQVRLHEQELKTAREEAEDARNTAEEALRVTQMANNAKSQFLSTLSEEIRTPLSSLLGVAELIASEDMEEEERRDYAKILLDSGKVLSEILNDLLDFSALESGKLKLVEADFDPVHVVKESVSLFKPLAAEKGLALEFESAVVSGRLFKGDKYRLRQILSNLISNAIKFTVHGDVTIALKEISRSVDSSVLEFSVTDSGVGITTENRARLFEPFTQEESLHSGKHTGTGLGLAIVKNLVELMDGAVDVVSAVNVGTRFSFRIQLPALNQPVEPVVHTQGKPSESTPSYAIDDALEILVVDDNPINVRVVTALLKKLKHHVQSLENGLLAVNAIRDGLDPDIILMDIQMPVMDGLEATRQIRNLELAQNTRHIPILALTGAAFEDIQKQCVEAGMDDYLTKPLDYDKFTKAIKQWGVSEPVDPMEAG